MVGQGTAAYGFSRQQEYEADAFGVELLRAIGFDQARIDRAAVGIYHLLGGGDSDRRSNERFLRSHPAWIDRATRMIESGR